MPHGYFLSENPNAKPQISNKLQSSNYQIPNLKIAVDTGL